MGLISSQFPFTDPGSLMGGIREHRVTLDGLQSDVFRSASQSQNTGQAARAFSGAAVTNDNTQTANLSQTATADMDKSVTINATTATVPGAVIGGFNYNYLQRYIAGADAANLLARGALNAAQDQTGDQSGFARLNDFAGTDSTAANDLEQYAQITQVVDVDLNPTVTNTTNAAEDGDAFQQARFRTISVTEENNSAQAVFTTGQRQGSAEAPSSQVAVGDGGDVTNTLVQTATVTQTGGTVNSTGLFDLRRDETGTLTPRSTELLAWLKNNSAVNSSASSQEQAIVQSAAGGVNEDGQQTENGRGTVVSNTGTSTGVINEQTDVINSVTILI